MKRLLLSLGLLFCFILNGNSQSCLEHDSLELVKIYNACGGVDWNITWDLSAPVSTWLGVTLMPDGCNIRIISINDNNLQGDFPFIELDSLITISISNNHLTSFDVLPNSNLAWLGLYNNDLTSIADLSNLSSSFKIIKYNLLDFSEILPNLPNVNVFSPQDSLSLTSTLPDVLAFPVGGDVADNTYVWYRNNVPIDTIIGDSTLSVSMFGAYRCEATNVQITNFLLNSKTYPIKAPTCLTNDSLELVKIYNACGGVNWMNSWDLFAPVSTWNGITLTSDACNVLKMNLYNEGLVDSFPDIQLSMLENLDLKSNQLSYIPDFTGIDNLIDLYLSSNLLSAVPDFSNFDSLVNLDLSSNAIEYVPNFSQLNYLRSLNLRSNELTSVPDFSNLNYLVSLYLANNKLSSVPNFKFLYLSNLDLSNNQLSTIPFSEFKYLITLNLINNKLTSVPDFKMPFLFQLYLEGNLLTTVPEFSGLPGLVYLFLDNNKLSTVPDFESDFLNIISLNDNLLTTVPSFSNLSELNELYLGRNQLSSVPTFTGVSANFRLHLEYNKLNFAHLLANNSTYSYSPQDSLGLFPLTPTLLSFPVGGDINDNTYTWYKDGIQIGTNIGDSTIAISGGGSYHCEAINSQLPDLTLYSRTINICGTANDELVYLGITNGGTLCNNEPISFNVFKIGTPQPTRYQFFINGTLVQGSTLNSFTSNKLNSGDIVTALIEDSNGCQYFAGSSSSQNSGFILIDIYPEPKIEFCQTNPTELIIKPISDALPISFDLIEWNEQGSDTIAMEIDSTITRPRNSESRYKAQNIRDFYCESESFSTAPNIVGCQSLCLGDHNPLFEENVAIFSLDFENINIAHYNISEIEVFPEIAVTSGDMIIEPPSYFPLFSLTIKNPNTPYTDITIRLTAETDCGIEIIELPIFLDKNCVWPGDANNDGQVITGLPNIPWVDDAIALIRGIEEVDAVSPLNGETLLSYKRPVGCSAANYYDWSPQSAKDWELELADGSRVPLMLSILDNNGNETATFNVKYNDCNADGILSDNEIWDPFAEPFTANPSNRSDFDVIAYHASLGSQREVSTSSAKRNFTEDLIQIITPDSTYNNGDEIVFQLLLGSAQNVVDSVVSIAFLAEAEFRTYRRPAIRLSNSALTIHESDVADYPFLVPNHPDSLRWHIAMHSHNFTPIQFSGQELCSAICHATVIGLLDEPSNKNNGGIPVKMKIPSMGIGLADGRVLYSAPSEVTVYINPDPQLSARIFLEGPYDRASGLMNDELRAMRLIPDLAPYADLGGYIFPRGEVRDMEVTASSVLSTTGQEAVVDWVFVEIRAAADTSLVSSCPALLTRNGMVVASDGVSPVILPRLPYGDYFVVLRHRNHLPVMTPTPIRLEKGVAELDFTAGGFTSQATLNPSIFGLIASDCACDYVDCDDFGYNVNGGDKAFWSSQNGLNRIYNQADLDLNADVNGVDRVLWEKNNGAFSTIPRD